MISSSEDVGIIIIVVLPKFVIFTNSNFYSNTSFIMSTSLKNNLFFFYMLKYYLTILDETQWKVNIILVYPKKASKSKEIVCLRKICFWEPLVRNCHKNDCFTYIKFNITFLSVILTDNLHLIVATKHS